MLTHTDAFSGFSVDDIERARRFYGETLGLPVKLNEMGILNIQVGRGQAIAYPKDNHVPATFTILNFQVSDIDAAVDELVAAGVAMERYEGMPHDERGIVRGQGPNIAWFKDPAGNILSVIQSTPAE